MIERDRGPPSIDHLRALKIGELKLEAPPRYKGGQNLGVHRFLMDVECWMRLMHFPQEHYIDIVVMHCEGGPQLWINNAQWDINAGLQSGWADYAVFCEEFVRTFEPTMDAELARQMLEGFKQTGKVAGYVVHFL